ncbi:MAG: hypothetical protein WDA72_10525 [Desulfomonilia bacterium]
MKRKEYISLVFTMLILLFSMLSGYVLLALVYEGNPLIVALVGLIVLIVSCFLLVYLYKLRKLVENEDKDDENKAKR